MTWSPFLSVEAPTARSATRPSGIWLYTAVILLVIPQAIRAATGPHLLDDLPGLTSEDGMRRDGVDDRQGNHCSAGKGHRAQSWCSVGVLIRQLEGGPAM